MFQKLHKLICCYSLKNEFLFSYRDIFLNETYHECLKEFPKASFSYLLLLSKRTKDRHEDKYNGEFSVLKLGKVLRGKIKTLFPTRCLPFYFNLSLRKATNFVKLFIELRPSFVTRRVIIIIRTSKFVRIH